MLVYRGVSSSYELRLWALINIRKTFMGRFHQNFRSKVLASRFFKQAAGFTLLELMAVVAIVAILAAIGIPAMNSLIESGKITTQRQIVADLIQLGRSEAVTRGVPVRLCPSSDGANCEASLSGGWLVTTVEGADSELIEVHQSTSNGVKLGGDFDAVEFQPSGNAVFDNGRDFTVCPEDATSTLSGKGVSLTLIGKPLNVDDIDCSS